MYFFRMAQSNLFFVFLVALICVSVACNQSNASGKSESKRIDSVWTTVLYEFDWQKNDYRVTTARRIIKDSIKTVYDTLADGKINGQSKLVLDTMYFVPIQSTLKDSTGNILKNKEGKDSSITVWPRLPLEKLLHDYNKKYK